MPAPARQLEEQRFHDEQACERAVYFQQRDSELRFSDADYLDHETWIRPAFAKLGSLYGKSVLDYGCGHGMAAVVLARQGATVTGFDLSPGYVAEARRRAAANDVAAQFVQADAEHLPFDEASFDAVWGCAILHHLDLTAAAKELRRVLRPRGVAVFCEPWGENPILGLARRGLPYPGKDRTPDEKPLRASDLKAFRRVFSVVEAEGYQLLGMLRRAWRRQARPGDILDHWDATLLQRFPKLKKWCRYVVLTLRS